MKIALRSILFLWCGITLIACIADEPALTYVYSHGLGSFGEHAIRYVKGHTLHDVPVLDKESGNVTQHDEVTIGEANPFYILYHPLHFFSYPSSSKVNMVQEQGRISIKKGAPSPKKASLAQHIEIEALKAEMEKVTGDCVLFGQSMGAATVITYMAEYKPKNVKAIILEAPFDTVENVIHHKIGFWDKLGLGALYLKYTHPAYNAAGIKPGKVAQVIDPTIPILFVHSKKDAFVPVEGSRAMYKAIKAAGNKNVHIFELKEAKHNNASCCSDTSDYQKVVHAFYKKYGLPYDEILATEGQVLFETTQPHW